MKRKNSNDDLMRIGWVKVPRLILDSQIIKNPILCQLYLWCSLKANHKQAWVNLKVGRGIQTVNCKPGQFITGRNKASEELGIPPSTFNSNLKRLRDSGYISIESTKHYSIVTVNINDDCAVDNSRSEQEKTRSNDKNRTTREQQTDTNNKNNNLKNYKKNNSLKSINTYNKFLSDSDFKKSDKNLFKEYERLVAVISTELFKIHSLPSVLTPSQYQDLRITYSRDLILEKLKQMDSWKGLKPYHDVYKLLTRFLVRSRVSPKSDAKIERDELGIPRVSLDGIFTDGIRKAEIDEELKCNDKTDWIRYDLTSEQQIRKYVAKSLRLKRYINESDLYKLKALEPISLKEFLILTKRSKIMLGSKDEDFELVKKLLREISSWSHIDNYKKQAKVIYDYLKGNNM
jgi:hypothetical protein